VTRQVLIGGRNKFFINDRPVQAVDVKNLFTSVKLNVNNPHFLIMQGRITKVINMKPAEILGLIEEATGTRAFEQKKQASINLIARKQLKVDEINRIIAEDIEPQLNKLSKDKTLFLKWSSNNNELEKLLKYCHAYDYWCFTEKLKRKKLELSDAEEDVTGLKKLSEENNKKVIGSDG
jgi:structural maintenance of chromosome 2